MHDNQEEKTVQLKVMNSPFNEKQADLLNQLLSSMTENQKIWLSGYLASAPALAPKTPVSQSGGEFEKTEAAKRTITVLYGSHTGNCEELAEQLSKNLKEKDFQVTVSSMDDFKTKNLKKTEDLLVLTSTHGDGDPPDNAMTFYEFLFSKRAPELKDVRYSVLALGDSSYEFFCQTGKDIDARLEELGAERLYERVDCDLDFEEPAETWKEGVLEKLEEQSPSAQVEGVMEAKETVVGPVYSKANPFRAEILENINLNGRGSNKEIRHIELDLEGSGLDYEPGDSIGILPENEETLTDELIQEMGWDGGTSVTITKDGEIRSVREALLSVYETTVLTKPLLEKASSLTENEDLKTLIEDTEAVKSYIYGRDLLDFVRDFGPWNVPAEEFLAILRKLPARLYSIASSSSANPDEVHLTIGALRYEANGRQRNGVCSVQCAERAEAGSTLPVFVQKNRNFRLPESGDSKVIMIGAGTGVAPYRAFLEEREEREDEGENWLFFGEQHFVTDFLYQTEWQRWKKDGLLSRMDVAFSRDTSEKIYVQNRLWEQRKEVFRWLQDGAYVYVCGDESRMAKDVERTLTEIVASEGSLSSEEASDYIKALRTEKRYLRDVY
ncbi:sulfite reductase (NADPH) flavoprotein alpha-component [Salimicrobium album]|uniref:Sulfite reductase (NADPH) flavoprotein alpha-component n=1 Tax=Salimicrobium album TaxID=50717 RepID=A0A1H3GYK2_9BACI|nr:sulfite reductase (NADPH) flavoprotein alpha-component [Salimicrobium album]